MDRAVADGDASDVRGIPARSSPSRLLRAAILGRVALAGSALLDALRRTDWASRVTTSGRLTYRTGPTGLAAVLALVTIGVAILWAARPSVATGSLMVVSALATAGASALVALASIDRANDHGHVGASATSTSYGLGAVVGVGSALVGFVIAAAALGASLSLRPFPWSADRAVHR